MFLFLLVEDLHIQLLHSLSFRTAAISLLCFNSFLEGALESNLAFETWSLLFLLALKLFLFGLEQRFKKFTVVSCEEVSIGSVFLIFCYS